MGPFFFILLQRGMITWKSQTTMFLATWFCLATIGASQMANLLLPGFQGHSLEASIKERNLSVTTYIVICPKTIRASECGIPGEGMTVIAAPTFAELRHSNNVNNTASLSCHIDGTTYASCHARQTISVQATLAPKDLNWMNIPVISTTEEAIYAPLSLPTAIASKITTETSSVSRPTAMQKPTAENMGISRSIISQALYRISASMVLFSMGYILLLAFLD
ncbi:uncharacterized protein N7473_010330 [Penicillium subrubescens]|uniref:uncharacterized protein n=1 Tax=Penicillium subrubescens TaxID=1316194 RepID=UPI00254575E1|nr:uncharacterized protein N7473_010330 [Penicillium subrubescens]KAJ5883444.1 hypothetical protein N7473_010330 [Penicillium subrubescens]